MKKKSRSSPFVRFSADDSARTSTHRFEHFSWYFSLKLDGKTFRKKLLRFFARKSDSRGCVWQMSLSSHDSVRSRVFAYAGSCLQSHGRSKRFIWSCELSKISFLSPPKPIINHSHQFKSINILWAKFGEKQTHCRAVGVFQKKNRSVEMKNETLKALRMTRQALTRQCLCGLKNAKRLEFLPAASWFVDSDNFNSVMVPIAVPTVTWMRFYDRK